MEHALRQYGITPPIYDHPDELTEMTGRRIWKVKMGDLTKETLPIFIKPVREKAAQGIVVRTWDDIKGYKGIEPDEWICCSEPVSFISEWRCFVRYGDILGIRHYNGDPKVYCDMSIIERATELYTSAPAAYALDVGMTDDGRTLLVEVNDGYAVGCYGLPNVLYAKFLTARWAELVGIVDPLDDRKL